jgi:hypothetical protein
MTALPYVAVAIVAATLDLDAAAIFFALVAATRLRRSR